MLWPGRPRLILPETVLLAQVIKSHQGRRLVDVTRRVVFGTAEAVAEAIAATRGGTQRYRVPLAEGASPPRQTDDVGRVRAARRRRAKAPPTEAAA